MKFLQEAAD